MQPAGKPQHDSESESEMTHCTKPERQPTDTVMEEVKHGMQPERQATSSAAWAWVKVPPLPVAWVVRAQATTVLRLALVMVRHGKTIMIPGRRCSAPSLLMAWGMH